MDVGWVIGWGIQKNGFLSALRLIPHPMITVAQPFQPEMHLCTERLNSCACEWMRQGSHHLGDKPLEKREWENTHHIPSKLHTLHTIQTQSLEKPSQMSNAPRCFDFFLQFFHLACSIVGHLRIGLRLRHWLPFWRALTTFLVPITTQNLGFLLGKTNQTGESC